MKKRILTIAILIAVLIAIPSMVFAATSGKCGDDITWTLEDGVLTLTGTGETYDYYSRYADDKNASPWNNGWTRPYLTKIVVEEGVTGLGEYVFYSLDRVTEISLPSTLKKIGSHALYGLDMITEISLPPSLVEIGDFAFSSCYELKSIEIPENVEFIGDAAFKDCQKLTTVNIPAKVKALTLGSEMNGDWDVFCRCFSLKKIDIHEDNEVYSSANGVIYDKAMTKILFISDAITGEFFLPASIPEMDFSIVPYRVSRIKVDENHPNYSSDSQGVVYNKDMTELIFVPEYRETTELYIPKTVTTISISYRDWPNDIEKFVVDEENTVFASDSQGGLYNKKMTKLIVVPREYKNLYLVPKGVTTIGDGAFYLSSSSNIILQEGVKTIGKEAFSYAGRLVNLTLPKSVTTVKDNAFEGIPVYDLYYSGSKSAYGKIKFGNNKQFIIGATIHYNHTCKHKNIKLKNVEYGATCVELELHRLKCPDCGFIERRYVGEYVHSKLATVNGKAATCTEEGLTYGQICENCDKIIVEQIVIPPLGHSGEWTVTKEATPAEDGMKTRTCTVCGETETMEYSLYKKGDVNKDGSVDAKDATQILRATNGKASAVDNMDESERLSICDVNGDNSIDAKDATQILRFVNGKASMFDK